MSKHRITLHPRNDPIGFAQRAQKNLEIIEHQYASRKDGHVVTQLILSTLGLLVYPYEANVFARFNSWRLDDLQQRGWPTIRQYSADRKAENLGTLLQYMRNAVCHRGLNFLSNGGNPDSRNIEEITLEFTNRKNRHSAVDWRMEMEATDLRELCTRVLHEISD